MRLFIAIELPSQIIDFLHDSNVHLRQISGVKPVIATNAHLTLLFLGNIKNPDVIIEKLKTVEFSCFEITASGIGFFPNKKDIKVAWLGVEPNGDLLRLQSSIALLFNESTKFIPHITIARVNNIEKPEKELFFKILQGKADKKFCFKVERFKLFSSELTPLGAVHRVLETFSATEKNI